MNLWVRSMIGSKGFKENKNSFKKRITYKIPSITIADIVEEMLENDRQKLKDKTDIIGKEPGE